jgi:hypothetical protein
LKFVKNIPLTDKALTDKLVSDGWQKIKEPKNLLTSILVSIPFMLAAGIISGLVICQFYNPFKELSSGLFSISISLDLKTLGYAGVLLAFILAHELIHAAFIPNFIKSKNTSLGIRGFGGFVSTTEIIPRGRFILISIAPYLLLSVVLPIVLGVLSLFNGFWMFLIILNAMGSSVDFLNAALILFQTPRNSYIVNNGFETYYTGTSTPKQGGYR